VQTLNTLHIQNKSSYIFGDLEKGFCFLALHNQAVINLSDYMWSKIPLGALVWVTEIAGENTQRSKWGVKRGFWVRNGNEGRADYRVSPETANTEGLCKPR